jgi:hypothetical protein
MACFLSYEKSRKQKNGMEMEEKRGKRKGIRDPEGSCYLKNVVLTL